MTKAQKKKEVKRQLKEMIKTFEESCIDKLDSVMASGSVPESFLTEGEYLLAKALIDSAMRERPFEALYYKEDFENIHTCS